MEIKQEVINENSFDLVNVKQEVNNNSDNAYSDLFSCEVCRAIFSSQGQLEAHVHTHKSKKRSRPYNCRFCSKTYITERYLTVHLLTHSEVKPYTCNVCEKGYVRRAKLEKHLLEVHNLKQQITENRAVLNKKLSENCCGKCGKEFMNLKLLNAHMRMECGSGDSFECDLKNVSLIFDRDKVPAKIATEKPALKQRKISKVYAPKKTKFRRPKTGFEWQCSLCPKSFMSKSEIRHHIKMHDQVRPFICSICSKDFPKNVQLKKHMKKHLAPEEANVEPDTNISSDLTNTKSNNNTELGMRPCKIESIIGNYIDSDFTGTPIPYIVENIVKREPMEDVPGKENCIAAFPAVKEGGKNLLHCEICGADFRNKSFLKLHLRTHRQNSV